MKGKWGMLITGIVLCLSLTAQADLADFLQYFASPNFGDDPGEPDTVYLVCSNQTATTQVIQVWLKTDNQNDKDSIGGVYIPLIITTDKPGVTLDTTIATAYSGTALETWNLLNFTANGDGSKDPSEFPLELLFGGVDAESEPELLGAGTYHLANLVFTIQEPTNICVDTTSDLGLGHPLHLATEGGGPDDPIDYQPQWQPICCGPVVPTLSFWGLTIFALILFSGLIYFLRKKRASLQT